MSIRAPILNYFQQRDRGWMLALFALVCLVYLPFLDNQFCFDDVTFFSPATLEYYEHAPFRLDLRWFSYASLGWTAGLFSDELPHIFHLGNTLLHAANSILLFYLLRQLLDAVVTQSAQERAIVVGAWVAALLFAVHPVAVYAVGYIVQRSILMATLFVLLMQMAYLRGLLTGRKRWLVVTVVCYFLAVFSKEHSVLAPAVLAAVTILLQEKIVVSKRALWLTWGGLLAVGAFVTLRSNGVLGAPYEAMATELFERQGVVASTPMLHLLSALTQAGLFFKYLLLLLLPNASWMSVDMREPFVASLADWRGWAGAIAFLGYGGIAVRLLLRGGMPGLAGFALLYPWVQFGVELVGIRVQEPFVLYRSYLWMPGLMLLIPLLLIRFSQRWLMAILACVAIVFVLLAWERLWVFGDNYRLWNDAALLLKDEKQAGADRIYYNRGQALMAAQKWDGAIKDFERSVAISPQLAPLHYALAVAYTYAGRSQEALAQYDATIIINPNDGDVYLAKGFALKQLRRDDEAMQLMSKACQMKNQMACIITSMGQH